MPSLSQLIIRSTFGIILCAVGLHDANADQPLTLAFQDSRSIGVVTANGIDPAAAVRCASDKVINDWLSRVPAQERRILPVPCQAVRSGSLFSWGDASDRNKARSWRFAVRSLNSDAVISRREVDEPRLVLKPALPVGDYQWSVAYLDKRGLEHRSDWRGFRVVGEVASAVGPAGANSVQVPMGTQDLPDGATVAARVSSKSRPRVLPAGSSFSTIAAAAQARDFKPVLVSLRSSATAALQRPVPIHPRAEAESAQVDRVAEMRSIQHIAGSERESIGLLALIGKIDNQPAMVVAARDRLLSMAAWPVDGPTSEKANNLTNREVYLGLATGLDLLWPDLDQAQRAAVVGALRVRVIEAIAELEYLNRVPYDPHRVSKTRWLTQTLMLAVGMREFPEAQGLLERLWDLSRFTLGVWGDADGSYGNGVAYGWYSFIQVVQHVATVRVLTGIDLYDIEFLRRAGEQLMAFTPPDHPQPSAFGDETETVNLYRNNASNFYRLHAQMTRDPVDAWYWQVRTANLERPALQLIWQLLLLGVDSQPLPQPTPPLRHSWFFREAGLAAVHTDASQSARTSFFFRSSQFGAFNHSHADQNSIALTVRGTPLLIGAGYYPYYGSPHHRLVTRATRYKNALTFDGGIGQSESRAGSDRPTEPMHSMDAHGELVRAETIGDLSVLTGDATQAYRAFDKPSGRWLPLLSNAFRSVVVDRSSGVVFVYDWATSDKPRRWELNLHSPDKFQVNDQTVRAEKGNASVCIDRHGPDGEFSQTQDWDVPPEIDLPPQAHGRFTVDTPSPEFASLMVLRGDCVDRAIRIQRSDARMKISYKGREIEFYKKDVTIR